MYRWNCVTTVRNAGFYVPQNSRILAKYLPVKTTALPPIGQKVVVKTAESYMGHVAVAVWDGKNLVSVVDSVGAGRVIPLSVYRGII